MEERIKEKVSRKKEKYKRMLIILMVISCIFLIFASSYKHPLIFTAGWVIIIAIELLAVFVTFWMGSIFLFAVEEREVRYEEITAFVKDYLERNKEAEVKNEDGRTCELIHDLQKKGKFFAKFLNDEKDRVHITYKYNEEDKKLSYECLYLFEFYEKYSFVETS